jgi:hypothetical protein
MAQQLTDADIARLDASAGKKPGALSDADIAAHDAGAQDKPGYLSQVGTGLWNTVKSLGSLVGEAGKTVTASSPEELAEHLKNLKAMVVDPQVDQAIEAAHKWKNGDRSEAVGHALAAIIPGVGPMAANIGEKLGDGDIKGAAADATVLGASMLAPHLAGPAVDAAKAAAPYARAAGAAVKEGVKAAAPDLAAGAGKIAAGSAIAAAPLPHASAVGGWGFVGPGVRQVGQGLVTGAKAGAVAAKASLASRIAAAADAVTPDAGATVAPAGLLGPGPVVTPAPPDGSFVRAVPAEYPPVEAPPPAPPVTPRALLPAAPEAPKPALVTPPPADTSFVRAVPAQYPEVDPEFAAARGGAQAAASKPAAAPAENMELLDALARDQIGKPFAKISPAQQSFLRQLAARMEVKEPEAAPVETPTVPVEKPTVPAEKPTVPAEAAAPAAPEASAAAAEEPEESAEGWGPVVPSPRVQFAPDGARLSPQMRAAQRIGANVDAKAWRFADALHKAGVGSDELTEIPLGRVAPEAIAQGAVPGWGNITDHLVLKGFLKKGETSPNQSIPKVIFALRRLESEAKIGADAAHNAGAAGEGQAVSGAGGANEGAVPQAGATAAGGGAPGESSATEVLIPGAQNPLKARYALRELDDITPSHSGRTFQPNENYPYKNDRDYNDPNNRGKVLNGAMQGQFDPRYHITDNPDATNGPIITDQDGNALGGNGRAMILQRVYGLNKPGAQAYRDLLTRKAAQFGIDPAEVAKMKQPVLVREIDGGQLAGEGAQDAITDLNKTGTAALTPAERAIADSRRVSEGTLDTIAGRLENAGADATLADVLGGKSGADILNRLIDDGVIGPQERAAYAKGSELTADGKTRISKLVLGRFFRDPAQLDNLAPSLRNKIERMAAPLARVERYEGWSLSQHLGDALDLLDQARAHGSANLDDVVNQSGLFGSQQFSPEAIALANALRDMKPTELTKAARQYAAEAKQAGERPGIFGESPEPGDSFRDAFAAASRK